MMCDWTLTGTVTHGRRLGRELGFPTANLEVPDGWGPADGVYRARATLGGCTYDAMSNLGCNPSVGGCRRRLETHLLGCSGDLYGRTLRVELLEKIRDERTFDSVEALRRQLEEDRRTVESLIEKDNKTR